MDNSKEEVILKEMVLKDTDGINESNLMTLPFVSMKRFPDKVIERKWKRGDTEVGIRVVGGEYGCPTMYELDVLLALFRIMMKSNENKYIRNTKDKTVQLPDKKINFTFKQIAREMGLKSYGMTIKNRIKQALFTLNESTLYSSLSLKNNLNGEYVREYNGTQSFRIINGYSYYSVEEVKQDGKKLSSPRTLAEKQYAIIDEFFYKNMCSNYFKVYNNEIYFKLKSNIAKKLFLILTQWSKGYEKYVTMQVLYDYIGLDIETQKDKFYYNRELKKALKQLQEVGFIDEFEFLVNDGVKFVFNKKSRDKKYGFDKYLDSGEIIARLRELGVDYDDILKYCNIDSLHYVAALLRYIDDKISLGQVNDAFKFVIKGLPYGKYNVDKYLLPHQ